MRRPIRMACVGCGLMNACAIGVLPYCLATFLISRPFDLIGGWTNTKPGINGVQKIIL